MEDHLPAPDQLPAKKTTEAHADSSAAPLVPKSLQVAICILLLLIGVAGLARCAFVTFGRDEGTHVPNIVLCMAGCCGMLGISLIWASYLGAGQRWRGIQFPHHLVHEVGTAFFGSFVVVTIIETTLHVHSERKRIELENEYENKRLVLEKRFRQDLALNQDAFQKGLKSSQDDFRIALGEDEAKHRAELLKETAIQNELRALLDHMAQKGQKDEAYYRSGVDAVTNLGKKMKHPQLPTWQSQYLDGLGGILMTKGQFRDAEALFQSALDIDIALNKNNFNDYALRMYVPISYQQLALAQVRQKAKYHEAVNNQRNAILDYVKLGRHIREQWALTKEKKLLEHLDSVLERCRNALVNFIENDPQISPAAIKIGPAVTCKMDEKEWWRAHKATLVKGKAYTIDLTTQEEELDPYLILKNKEAKLFLYDDDGGNQLNSRLTFNCPQDGDYWIIATSSPNPALGREKKTGEVQLMITELKTEKK